MKVFFSSSNLALVFEQKEEDIMANEDMRHVFTDPRTGRVYEEGDILKRERLAETLEELASAEDPVNLFYKGKALRSFSLSCTSFKRALRRPSLPKSRRTVSWLPPLHVVATHHALGGYVSVEDLASYETVIHDTPLESEILGELVMCGPPPPSSFAVTQSIITVMAGTLLANSPG